MQAGRVQSVVGLNEVGETKPKCLMRLGGKPGDNVAPGFFATGMEMNGPSVSKAWIQVACDSWALFCSDLRAAKFIIIGPTFAVLARL